MKQLSGQDLSDLPEVFGRLGSTCIAATVDKDGS